MENKVPHHTQEGYHIEGQWSWATVLAPTPAATDPAYRAHHLLCPEEPCPSTRTHTQLVLPTEQSSTHYGQSPLSGQDSTHCSWLHSE